MHTIFVWTHTVIVAEHVCLLCPQSLQCWEPVLHDPERDLLSSVFCIIVVEVERESSGPVGNLGSCWLLWYHLLLPATMDRFWGLYASASGFFGFWISDLTFHWAFHW